MIVPVLLQVPLKESVELVAVIVPVLLQLVEVTFNPLPLRAWSVPAFV